MGTVTQKTDTVFTAEVRAIYRFICDREEPKLTGEDKKRVEYILRQWLTDNTNYDLS